MIPYMWTDFAQQIALSNMDFPEKRISDEFLLKVVEQGEKMDIWGKDAYASANLQTRNSSTNWKNLKELMGEELFNEMNKYPISLGIFCIPL